MNYNDYSFDFNFDLNNMPPSSCLNGIYDPYNGFEDPDNIMSGLISTKELIDDDNNSSWAAFRLFMEDQRNHILSRRFSHYGDDGEESDNEWVYLIADRIFDSTFNDTIPDSVVKYYNMRVDYLKEKALKEDKEIKMDKLIQRIENMEKLLTEHNID
jgi:hypothetical protein